MEKRFKLSKTWCARILKMAYLDHITDESGKRNHVNFRTLLETKKGVLCERLRAQREEAAPMNV